jgi:hypothetical protein
MMVWGRCRVSKETYLRMSKCWTDEWLYREGDKTFLGEVSKSGAGFGTGVDVTNDETVTASGIQSSSPRERSF